MSNASPTKKSTIAVMTMVLTSSRCFVGFFIVKTAFLCYIHPESKRPPFQQEVFFMDHTPRVAAVHDLSGFGLCSLNIALPVLSVLGCQCCCLPTASLSAHTGFPASPHSVFLDLTSGMEGTIAHWQELGASFDAIYSGFLGSASQFAALHRLLSVFRKPDTLVLVDPVMGDHGAPYRTYTPEMCALMSGLADKADLITPNLTEAAMLLHEPYDPAPGEEKTEHILSALSLGGQRSVVLTGISRRPGFLGCAAYDRESGGISYAEAPRVPGVFSGTGDLFSSVLLGRLLQGVSLEKAAESAVSFIHLAARRTYEQGLDPVCGPDFEPLLSKLMQE